MKKVKFILSSIVTTAALFALISASATAAPFEDEKMNTYQPDGSMVEVTVTGDEFYRHVESLDGYTLIKNDDEWICYAKLNEDGTELIATDTVFTGKDDNVPEGLEKHLEITQESVDKKIEEARAELNVKDDKKSSKTSSLLKARAMAANDDTYNFSQSKTITGLTVVVDFQDEKAGFTNKEIEDFFNMQGYKKYGNNGSIHDFFYDISGGRINYTNKVIRFIASGKKSEYENTTDVQKLAREVNNWIKNTNQDISDVSKKTDGTIWMMNVLYAGQCRDVWSKGLWPHKSAISLDNDTKNQVYEMCNLGDELSIGTICHENGHALLGYPDLYAYNTGTSYTSKPSLVGGYCLMGSANLVGGSKNPVPPNPYLRLVVSKFPGTIYNLNSVSKGQTITLNSDNKGRASVYKWRNTNRSKEYYLIENINKQNRYASVNESGLVIWHVDEEGSNSTVDNARFLNTVIEADGEYNLKNSKGAIIPFSVFTNAMVNSTSTPNAKWYDGTYSGLNMSDISVPGTSMTFKLGFYYYNQIGWRYVDGKKSYYLESMDGTRAKGTKTIGGKEYYFDKVTGIMQTGWVYVNGQWRHYGEDGIYIPNDKGCRLDVLYVPYLDPTVYKNVGLRYQSSVGKDITLVTRLQGVEDSDGYTYCYRFSYQNSTNVYQFETQYMSDKYRLPITGMCSITVKVKDRNNNYVCDKNGNEITSSELVEVNNAVKINEIKTQDIKSGADITSCTAGQTIRLDVSASGGCYYCSPVRYYNYTIYRLDPATNEEEKSGANKTIITAATTTQAWTPRTSGFYKINVEACDQIGSKDKMSTTFLVK